MSEKRKDKEKASRQEAEKETAAQTPETAASGEDQPTQEAESSALQAARTALAEKEDQYLRLAAEYDNYRKRTAKEKESAWTQAKADTVAAFLPVYDNLERALKQETSDEAYAKGVEMTMNQLKEILAKLDIQEIPALGQTFDPNLHNAVMHVEDEQAGENTVVEVFQAGFRTGEKVIRFAMVKVAN